VVVVVGGEGESWRVGEEVVVDMLRGEGAGLVSIVDMVILNVF
jgi:hypothetical protein